MSQELNEYYREQIKNLVYNCASKKFYSREEFFNKVMKSPNDGEDLQIYNEIGFDSLDMVEFLIDIETKLESLFKLECMIDDNIITNNVTFRNIIDYILKIQLNNHNKISNN